MFTLFNRRHRRHRRTVNSSTMLMHSQTLRGHSSGGQVPKRAASLPPTRLQRQQSGYGGQINNNLNDLNNNNNNHRNTNAAATMNDNADYCQQHQQKSANLLYGELPWHVSHSDIYAVTAGAQQNFPEVQKMSLFGSVPALHQMNSMNGGDGSNNNSSINNGRNMKRMLPDSPSTGGSNNPEEEGLSMADETFVGTLRYFNLRQPVNLAGSFQPKVIVHEVKGEEENGRNLHKCLEHPTVIQPLSLMPDWR